MQASIGKATYLPSTLTHVHTNIRAVYKFRTWLQPYIVCDSFKGGHDILISMKDVSYPRSAGQL